MKMNNFAKIAGILLRGRWLLIVLVAFLLSSSGCGGRQPEPVALQSVTEVQLVSVRIEAVPDEVEAPGTVRSANTADVAARTMGTVLEVRVREGDRVRQGQLLVQIDETELVARRNAAQAALKETVSAREEAARGVAVVEASAEIARKTYERFVYLREQKSVSPQEFDEVEAKHRAASAGLAQARARQQQVESMHERAQSEARAAETVAGYARVSAPFDSVVVRRSVDPGRMAMPGMTLMTVEDPFWYQLEATVDASAAARCGLKRGAKARVVLDALPGSQFEGAIAELEAGADPASQTLRAKVDLPRDPIIRSGLFGRALFGCGERKALALPATTVIERGQLQSVYVVDAQGIARLRVVTLGRNFGEQVEVLSGLEEGERVVVNPRNRELDGKKVKP